MRTTLFALSVIPLLVSALPFRKESVSALVRRAGIKVPIKQWTRPGTKTGIRSRDLNDTPPSVGLGDLGDLIYAVNVNVGGTDVAVHMDTGSSDLWVISNTCNQGTCPGATGTALPARTGKSTGAQVTLNFGDSFTGTTAQGPIHQADTQIAGLTLPNHPYAAVEFTNNSIVGPGVPTSGILGLSFPSASFVQAAVVKEQLGGQLTIDQFLSDSSTTGPLLTRLALSGELPQPMFTITLQRNTIDVGGNQGALTLGDLPDGVDNDTLTWVPVRLYTPAQGGLSPPSFAPDEIYPLRWEVQIDNVFFDGQKLPQPAASKGQAVTALVDSGNSLLRGPSDLVQEIFSAIDPKSAKPEFPCSQAHTLEYEIGGKRFPIDPRDFVSPSSNSAETCDASRLVITDPPAPQNTLFSWSLGDPFFKSNLVAFYFGNLTHPSLDPPRIGFLSTVPKDADTQLVQAVNDAQANGNKFTSVFNVAPTSTLGADATIVKTSEAASTSTTETSTSEAQTTSEAKTTSLAQTSSTSTTSEAAETTSSSSIESSPSTEANTSTSSSTSTSSAAQQTSSSQAATTPPAGAANTDSPAGPSTTTNVVLVTAPPSTPASNTPSPSPTSGALRGLRTPVIWTVVLGSLVVALVGM